MVNMKAGKLHAERQLPTAMRLVISSLPSRCSATKLARELTVEVTDKCVWVVRSSAVSEIQTKGRTVHGQCGTQQGRLTQVDRGANVLFGVILALGTQHALV